MRRGETTALPFINGTASSRKPAHNLITPQVSPVRVSGIPASSGTGQSVPSEFVVHFPFPFCGLLFAGEQEPPHPRRSKAASLWLSQSSPVEIAIRQRPARIGPPANSALRRKRDVGDVISRKAESYKMSVFFPDQAGVAKFTAASRRAELAAVSTELALQKDGGASQRRGRRALLNQQVQLVQIDRFDQMMFESCFVTLADVVFHPKTG